MSSVVTKSSGVTTKFQASAAALAIAAAAVLTPAVIAQADPGAPNVVAQAVGRAADSPLWFLDNSPSAAVSSFAPGGPHSIFQNPFIWIGTPNPSPPATGNVFVFTPLTLVPGFLKPLYSWFTQGLNFQVCILGASVKIGPYGTVTGSLGRGC